MTRSTPGYPGAAKKHAAVQNVLSLSDNISYIFFLYISSPGTVIDPTARSFLAAV